MQRGMRIFTHQVFEHESYDHSSHYLMESISIYFSFVLVLVTMQPAARQPTPSHSQVIHSPAPILVTPTQPVSAYGQHGVTCYLS